jgi:hypothetical protein
LNCGYPRRISVTLKALFPEGAVGGVAATVLAAALPAAGRRRKRNTREEERLCAMPRAAPI